MRLGNAKLTATTQYFLDTCPAVKSWTPNTAETECTFVYDPSIEVPVVPDGVEFSEDDLMLQDIEREEAGRVDHCRNCGALKSVCTCDSPF